MGEDVAEWGAVDGDVTRTADAEQIIREGLILQFIEHIKPKARHVPGFFFVLLYSASLFALQHVKVAAHTARHEVVVLHTHIFEEVLQRFDFISGIVIKINSLIRLLRIGDDLF